MTLSKKFAGAAALLVFASTVAAAQISESRLPGGLGGGLGGAVAPVGVPSSFGGFSSFGGVGAGGLTVSNPAGGTVNVSQAAAQALAAVVDGSATAEQRAAAVVAVGGGAAGQALIAALGQISTGGPAAVVSAVGAYNAAVDATPAGGSPPPGLLAVRSALGSLLPGASR